MDNNPFLQENFREEKTNVFIDLLQTIVVALSICVIVYLFIATPNEVHGQSMEPNFHNGELLLTNKMIQYLGNTRFKKIFGEYQRGDVVIFKHVGAGVTEDYIKRVIAVGGDTVMISEGKVFVNGKAIEEPYLPPTTRTDPGNFLTEGKTIKVPENSFIVLGDNRGNSTDSRSSSVNIVKRSDMKGKVFFRYWPIEKFGVIKGHKFPEK